MNTVPSGSRRYCRFARCAIATAIVATASLCLHADTYQFIISGYPAANESYPASSAGTAIATATRRVDSAAAPLEARYRTWDESYGVALRSDKFQATMVIIK